MEEAKTSNVEDKCKRFGWDEIRGGVEREIEGRDGCLEHLWLEIGMKHRWMRWKISEHHKSPLNLS